MIFGKWIGLFALVHCLHPMSAGAERTWTVRPDSTGDAPTIQAALDSAQSGDTVLLEPGTYAWSTQGDDGNTADPSMIRMRAGVTLRGARGADATILDAEGQGRVVLCEDVQEAVIEGLTILGGTTSSSAGGGGILVLGDSRPLIEGCTIQNNTLESGAGGAGIRCDAAEIRDCRIQDNSTAEGGFGGGIACLDAVVESCIVLGNVSRGGNSGGGQGGGIWSRGASLSHCWFESNATIGEFGAFGGGLFEAGPGTVTDCTFVDNAARGASGRGLGGGAYVSDGTLVRECVLVRNEATHGALAGLGGGIYCRPGAAVTQCTFVANSTGVHVAASVAVTACIVVESSGGACSGSDATWSCTDLFGNEGGDSLCGQDGGGNFSADPAFCGVDAALSLNVFLQDDSPCVAGNHPQGASCEGIGARPAACGAVSSQPVTWSRFKTLYR